jgi:small-conductance mechanosensitive channel
MGAFEAQHAWFFLIFLFCVAIGLANLAHYLLFRFTRLKKSESGVRTAMRRHLSKPVRAISILVCVMIALPFVPKFSNHLRHFTEHALIMALVATLGWFAAGTVYVVEAAILRKYDLTAGDFQARKIHTRFGVVRRLAISFIAIITLAALLWTFNDPRIWQYGTGLLASAGLASLVLATAAKSTASNVLAGIQIAFTGMIRIDDVVVVKGELGRVEEITSAYVVLEIWDFRRMIVPLSYFIENPFFNWTRQGTEVIARAFLYMDYTIPVEEVRTEFQNIVMGSSYWDGKICELHVTELTDRTVELRCQVSAADRIKGFELCCVVRERIMAWIREHYPTAFPMTRFQMLPQAGEGPGDDANAGAAGKGIIRST